MAQETGAPVENLHYYPKWLATFSHAPGGIWTRTVLRYSGNALDHKAVRAGPDTWMDGWIDSWTSKGPVTLGSDYRTILKSDPILLILRSELDVPILKIDKFAVTLLRFIAADFFIARKMRQWFVLR